MPVRLRSGVLLALAMLPLWSASPAAAAARPDLQVTAVGAPATVSVSGILDVTDTVRNAGQAGAGASSLAIFLSKDRRVGHDRRIGAVPVKALGPGLSVSAETELSLSKAVRVGTYYLVACADAKRKVRESSETNNCRVGRAIHVTKAHAELVVTGLASVPSTLRADLDGTVRVTVRNRGGRASAGATLRVLVSVDATYGKGDVQVGVAAIRALPPRAAATVSVTVRVLYVLATGRYRLLACLAVACRAAGSATSVILGAVHAPPIPQGVPTEFQSSVDFLWSGPGAPQQGVAAGAIAPQRVAVLRGRVVNRQGQPLAGVKVTALDHPELGFTFTRADGTFDLAVNGGGLIQVDYRAAGYLPVQRTEMAPWQDFARVDDVVLTPVDSAVTAISSGSASWQVHQSSRVSDADGARQATLLFAPGTHASLRMANGTLVPASTIHVRATEFTVGADGPAAMPGTLPPTSDYTYAAEYSADEAIAAGAVGVNFDKPVVVYTDNFLGFPVGVPIPLGTYAATRGRWEAETNGQVVEVMAGGLDVDGDGVVDSGAALTALGITPAEVTEATSLFALGTQLMRIAITHFSAEDQNLSGRLPPDAIPPDGSTQPAPAPGDCTAGSVIFCDTQVLGERVPIAGTPYNLVYSSDRVPGRVEARTVRIRLRPDTVPADLESIHLAIYVAGQTFVTELPPTTTNYTYTWDGKDAYGRTLLGEVPLKAKIGYQYNAIYATSPAQINKSFAGMAGLEYSRGAPPTSPAAKGQAVGVVVMPPVREPIVVWRTYSATVANWDQRGLGLGGWGLDAVEAFDRDGGVLQNGDGTSERADETAYDTIAPIAGGAPTGLGDGGAATSAHLASPDGVAVAPDGTLYIADVLDDRVRRVDTQGTISTVYGGTSANTPADVATASDGSAYVADSGKHEIIRIAPDGTSTVVAGTGTVGYTGDGGPATQAELNTPNAIAVGPDDSVWFADSWPSPPNDVRIRRIAPDGTIWTEIGGGPAPQPADPYQEGAAASQVRIAYVNGNGLAVGPDGTVYVIDTGGSGTWVRAIGPDGISHRFAGGGSPGPGSVGDGGPATSASLNGAKSLAVGPDGSVYIGEATRLRMVSPTGIISTIAGGPNAGYGGDNGPADSALVSSVWAVAVAPNGDIIFADHGNNRVRAVRSILRSVAIGSFSLASADGTQVYRFDAAGRHVSTLDGLTGTTHLTLAYDAAGRLVKLTDVHGRVTTIEHSASGNPTAIVAPGGQRTTLNANADGYLASIADPLGNTTHLVYNGAGGLLTGLTDPRGNAHTFGWDATGLLASDQEPGGATQTLARTRRDDGADVTITSQLGRTRTFSYTVEPDGSVDRQRTDAAGAVTDQLERPDGTVTITNPDGRVDTLTTGPDPRFGQRVALVTKAVVAEPSGPTSTTTAARAITATPGGGLATLTDTIVRNGNTWTFAYDGAAHTETVTSPAGRTSSVTLNGTDDIVSYVRGNLDPVSQSYDQRGRLTQIAQGNQHVDIAWNASDEPVSITDALGRTTAIAYDASGAVSSTTRPTGELIGVHHDASGNLSGYALPGAGNPSPALLHDGLDRITSFTAPGRGALTMAYTGDRQLASVTEPGGGSVAIGYDSGGRQTSSAGPDATTAWTYADLTGRPSTATRTPTSGTAQASAFTYAGDLITRDQQTGAAAGDFHYTYGSDLDLTGWSIDGGSTSAIARDADLLITGDGPLDRTVDGNGDVTGIAEHGDPTDALGYTHDSLGRLTGRTVTVNGSVVASLAVTYDAAGQVASTTLPAPRSFSYDADGRLTGVSGGAPLTYAYDARDNMTSGPAGAITSTVDDRVISVGATSYAYDSNGRLSGRGADTFTYSAGGRLLTATVGPTTVTYGYDAAGRRVSRSDGTTTTQYLYGNGDIPYQLTASKQGGVTTVYRYDAQGNLAEIERSGSSYLVATDQVGSPVGVYDTATGSAVLQRSYDPFGRLLSQTGGFDLPIGFAGGVADPTTGLTLFGARDYDPDTGHFTAPDPILYDGRSLNLYAYVGENPSTNIDRSGLAAGGCDESAPSFEDAFPNGLDEAPPPPFEQMFPNGLDEAPPPPFEQMFPNGLDDAPPPPFEQMFPNGLDDAPPPPFENEFPNGLDEAPPPPFEQMFPEGLQDAPPAPGEDSSTAPDEDLGDLIILH
jgi:RHS repeat-associated protein